MLLSTHDGDKVTFEIGDTVYRNAPGGSHISAFMTDLISSRRETLTGWSNALTLIYPLTIKWMRARGIPDEFTYTGYSPDKYYETDELEPGFSWMPEIGHTGGAISIQYSKDDHNYLFSADTFYRCLPTTRANWILRTISRLVPRTRTMASR